MNLAKGSVNLMITLMLFIILLPAVAGLINVTEGDDFPGINYLEVGGFAVAWSKMQNHQTLSGLMMRMSIFSLFVVYLGGRSNDRRFNDRTIDSNILILFSGIFSVMALYRAIFVLLFFAPTIRYYEKIFLNTPKNPIDDSLYEEVSNHAFNY